MFSGYTGISPSVCPSVCMSVCAQNTTFCQSAGGGIESHSVTALGFVLDRIKNIVGEGENAGCLFPQCFQKALYSGSLKERIVQ